VSEVASTKTKNRTFKGRYLYCFIDAANANQAFDIPPVPVPGVEGNNRVYTVVEGKVAAVVSNSPVVRYPVTRPSLLAHERILEYVMQRMTTLPVKYGTVANSEAELRNDMLLARQEELVALLERFRNRVEVSVKALWQRERIFGEIVQQPHIAELKAKAAANPQSQNDMIEIGQAVERALEEARETDTARILAYLSPLAVEVKLNPITLEMLVINAAFLVDNEREAEFDQAVNALDDEFGERLTLKYAGPLPPFNFMSLNLNKEEE